MTANTSACSAQVSRAFACATPFVALATLAAFTMPHAAAAALMLIVSATMLAKLLATNLAAFAVRLVLHVLAQKAVPIVARLALA